MPANTQMHACNKILGYTISRQHRETRDKALLSLPTQGQRGLHLEADKERGGRQEGVYPEKVVVLVRRVHSPFHRLKLRAPGWGAYEAALKLGMSSCK